MINFSFNSNESLFQYSNDKSRISLRFITLNNNAITQSWWQFYDQQRITVCSVFTSGFIIVSLFGFVIEFCFCFVSQSLFGFIIVSHFDFVIESRFDFVIECRSDFAIKSGFGFAIESQFSLSVHGLSELVNGRFWIFSPVFTPCPWVAQAYQRHTLYLYPSFYSLSMDCQLSHSYQRQVLHNRCLVALETDNHRVEICAMRCSIGQRKVSIVR